MGSCPAVVIVVYDPSRRAPASEGDFLGIMSLGCAMQSMWLTAQALGVGMQIMSVFSSGGVEDELRRILSIPGHLRVAFACRLGYPGAPLPAGAPPAGPVRAPQRLRRAPGRAGARGRRLRPPGPISRPAVSRRQNAES
jgi:nitroreductase